MIMCPHNQYIFFADNVRPSKAPASCGIVHSWQPWFWDCGGQNFKGLYVPNVQSHPDPYNMVCFYCKVKHIQQNCFKWLPVLWSTPWTSTMPSSSSWLKKSRHAQRNWCLARHIVPSPISCLHQGKSKLIMAVPWDFPFRHCNIHCDQTFSKNKERRP